MCIWCRTEALPSFEHSSENVSTMARPTKVEKDAAKFPGDAKLIIKKKKPAGAKKRKSGISKSKRKAIREIRDLAKRTRPMVPRAAYERLFREIGNKYCVENQEVRWKKGAIEILICGAEGMMEKVMSKAAKLTDLRNAETLSVKDLKSVLALDAIGN